jgi:hypothetical protein
MKETITSNASRESHGPNEIRATDITDERREARAGSETNESILPFDLWVQRSVAVTISETVGRAIDGKTNDTRLRVGR